MGYFLADAFKDMEVYTPGEQPTDRDYIKLNANESSFPPSPAILKAINETVLDSMAHYSDPNCMELRKAIGEVYHFPPSQIFVGNGADEVLTIAFQSFYREGYKISFPEITYDFYRTYAKSFKLDYEMFPLNDDLTINVDDYLREPDRDVVLANPNNPTGIAISLADIEKILRVNPKRLVIVDEAYVDYGNESCLSLVDKYENLLVVQTFSKSRNVPGARIGFGIGAKSLISDMNNVKFCMTPFNMSTVAIKAGTAIVKSTDYFHKYINTIINIREKFEDELEALGFKVIRSTTNFTFFREKNVSAETMTAELKKRGILVRHFDHPQIRGYVRVTIGTEEEMNIVLAAIQEIEEEGELFKEEAV